MYVFRTTVALRSGWSLVDKHDCMSAKLLCLLNSIEHGMFSNSCGLVVSDATWVAVLYADSNHVAVRRGWSID